MRSFVLICIVLALLAQVSQADTQEEWVCLKNAVVYAVPSALGGVVLILAAVVTALALKAKQLQKQLDCPVDQPKQDGNYAQYTAQSQYGNVNNNVITVQA